MPSVAEEIKFCWECKETHPITEFYRVRRGDNRHQLACKKSTVVRNRLWARKIKNSVIARYGGKCACCGESMRMFLTLDHIQNNGAQDRRIGSGGKSVYARLHRAKDKLPGFQVLCSNCNLGKFLNKGACPHSEE